MKNAYVYIPDEPTLNRVKNDLNNQPISNDQISIIKPEHGKNNVSVATDNHLSLIQI